MVLEDILEPNQAEKHPWEMFFIGILISSVSLFIGIQLFKSQASLVAVFLTVLASTPLIYKTIKAEEAKDTIENVTETFLLKEHSRALSFFVFLFLGIVISFTFWYVLMPQDMANQVFSIQVSTIKDINNGITSHQIANTTLFSKILLNNLKVLIFCVIFAFFYGAGAIFILTWNASVVAVAIGVFAKSNIANYAAQFGFDKLALYFSSVSLGMARYLIHGIPEITAYFVGGLAGGIISVSMIRHHFLTKKFDKILLDSADLLLLACLILTIAAFMEVYITPLMF
ncbi:stage II sporulation protein M [Nanoarchaeota archaeon]